MNPISWKDAMKKVRGSYLCEVYQKRKGSWFKYSKSFGNNIDVEEVDKWEVPKEVKTARKVEGCNTIFTNGMFDIRTVVKGCPMEGNVVVEHRYNSDAAAVGAAVGGLLRGLFK
jgi:hypothetical protein